MFFDALDQRDPFLIQLDCDLLSQSYMKEGETRKRWIETEGDGDRGWLWAVSEAKAAGEQLRESHKEERREREKTKRSVRCEGFNKI